MIEWNDSLSLGIDEIDRQHRELVRRFNKFAEAVNHGYTKESLVEMLYFMGSYADYHFESEERLMRNVGYPGIASHILIHKEFLGKQFWLYEGSHFGDLDVARETVDFLEKWITEHVAVEDKKIGEYVARHPVSEYLPN